MLLDEPPQPGRLLGQCRRRLRGQHPRHHRQTLAEPTCTVATSAGACSEYHVGIRSADAERRHASTPRSAGLVGPRTCASDHLDRSGRPIHLGCRRIQMQCRGYHPVPNRLDGLDHPGDTGRMLCMTDVRLDRTDQQWPRRRVGFAVCCLQRFGFDRIADLRTSAVRLDHVDVARGQVRIHQRLTNHPLLRWTARGGQHIGGSVLSDGAAPDERKHWVTEAACARQPSQHQHAGALGDAEPVRRRSERLASAVFGQRALSGESDVDAR